MSPALAPLIDPNEHSCGTVRPTVRGSWRSLKPAFYFAGMKSYGRAPDLPDADRYEQVRSIVADIAGDRESAERVELVLPETGVCSRAGRGRLSDGLLRRPAKANAAACCAADDAAKAKGAIGCGCGENCVVGLRMI